jgi:hypothetical protein
MQEIFLTDQIGKIAGQLIKRHSSIDGVHFDNFSDS